MTSKLRFTISILTAIISLGFMGLSQAASGGGSIEISQVFVDSAGGQITIKGNGLSVGGIEPTVTLEGFTVTVTTWSTDQIIATYSSQEFVAGDYLLTVYANSNKTKKPQSAEMMLTLGSVGPQGERGPVGPQGPPGVTPEQLVNLENRIIALEELLIPTCNDLPPMLCEGTEEYCGDLLPFEPTEGPGYDNYPINGETAENQYRSYVRRDLMMLVKHATAKVACIAGEWTFGNGGPLGLGDMSESDGAIPGTSTGTPGHPAGTHEDGRDIDVAYYQTDTADNRLREICTVVDYHCGAPPHLLDADRTALFLGYLAEHPRLRVIGVDGQAGLAIENAALDLCADGSLSDAACEGLSQVLAYELTDHGWGWFRFHYDRIHISMNPITP